MFNTNSVQVRRRPCSRSAWQWVHQHPQSRPDHSFSSPRRNLFPLQWKMTSIAVSSIIIFCFSHRYENQRFTIWQNLCNPWMDLKELKNVKWYFIMGDGDWRNLSTKLVLLWHYLLSLSCSQRWSQPTISFHLTVWIESLGTSDKQADLY